MYYEEYDIRKTVRENFLTKKNLVKYINNKKFDERNWNKKREKTEW